MDFHHARASGIISCDCGGGVFVGSNDGRFYVLAFSNGAKVWEFNAGAALSASPAIANGRIVIGSQDGRLCASAVEFRVQALACNVEVRTCKLKLEL